MLAPWKKSYDQPKQHIKKQRQYFANKGPSSQSYGFSNSIYGCESWTIKKSECQRIDVFEMWYWRRLFRIPWTTRRSNQSILNEISPKFSLEVLILELRFQYLAIWYEELTHWKRPWCWERVKAGGERDNAWWDDWMWSPTQWTWVWANSGSCWWTGKSGMLQSMGSQRVRHDWVTEPIWHQSKA